MLTQINRAAKLFTPLGSDVLCLVEISVREALGSLFVYEIHAISENVDIDFDKLIGQAGHVELDRGPSGKRMLHGVITEGEWLGVDHGLAHYRLVLRPWFWLLDKIADCRIFHDKTVLEIIRETFGRRGFSDFRVATTYDYPVLHYTVQYRETDFNFLSRLMEQHGIYYYFEHTADRHVLVLCDGRASHSSAPGLENVAYVTAKDAGHLLRRPTIQAWRMRRMLRSGRSGLQDFNHLTPNTQMLADAAATEKYTHSTLELYDYPGPHVVQSDGERYARIRLEAEQALDKRRSAMGYAVSAFAGAFLTLSRHPRGGENGQYLLVGTRFSFGPQSYRAQPGEEEGGYRGEYDLLPVDVPFRAPMTTPKPRIDSTQTAIVVGQKGEEIDCDDHGRILVHFHWDRHEDQSCRLRVAQNWAGQGWGGQIIPRIGMEVSVVYLEGDPDRPLVTGCVPDPVNHRVPYELPANKTKAVFRSDTYKGTGFNELTFEDANGREEIYLHAQKDHTLHIENNRAKRVDNNQSESIGHNKSIEVGNNHDEIIGGNMTLMIGPNVFQRFVTSKFRALTDQISKLANKLGIPEVLNMGEGNLVISVGKNKAETVMVSSTEIVGGAKTTAVGGGYQLSVQGIRHDSVLMGAYEEVGQNKTVVVGKTFEIVCGKTKLRMEEQGTITIEAEKHIVLKAKRIDLNP